MSSKAKAFILNKYLMIFVRQAHSLLIFVVLLNFVRLLDSKYYSQDSRIKRNFKIACLIWFDKETSQTCVFLRNDCCLVTIRKLLLICTFFKGYLQEQWHLLKKKFIQILFSPCIWDLVSFKFKYCSSNKVF